MIAVTAPSEIVGKVMTAIVSYRDLESGAMKEKKEKKVNWWRCERRHERTGLWVFAPAKANTEILHHQRAMAQAWYQLEFLFAPQGVAFSL